MLDLSYDQIGEFVFIIFFFLSIFLVIHAFLNLFSQHSRLKLRMTEVSAELELLRPKLPGKRDEINALKKVLPPLKRTYQKMVDYQYKLQLMMQKVEEEEKEQGQGRPSRKQTEEEAKREIRLHSAEWDNDL